MTLACPNCGETDRLATIERLTGLSLIAQATVKDGKRDLDFDGYTDVDWDSSTTKGITCRGCAWEYVGISYLDQLVEVMPDAE